MGRRKHGESVSGPNGRSTKEYQAYRDMLNRCYNFENTKDFPLYGGRGISVARRWLGRNGFKNFLADMGRAPSKAHSLDRKSTDGHYTKSNCRWLDWYGQAENRRTTRWIEFRGHRKCLVGWARFIGVTPQAINLLIKRRGMSEQDAIAYYVEKHGLCLESPTSLSSSRSTGTGPTRSVA